MKTRQRLLPCDRKRAILEAAVDSAIVSGFTNVTRGQVAERAGCTDGLVSHYFSTVSKLRRAIMRAAIEGGHVKIIADGIAAGDEQARRAPAALLDQARASLAAR